MQKQNGVMQSVMTSHRSMRRPDSAQNGKLRAPERQTRNVTAHGVFVHDRGEVSETRSLYDDWPTSRRTQRKCTRTHDKRCTPSGVIYTAKRCRGNAKMHAANEKRQNSTTDSMVRKKRRMSRPKTCNDECIAGSPHRRTRQNEAADVKTHAIGIPRRWQCENAVQGTVVYRENKMN